MTRTKLSMNLSLRSPASMPRMMPTTVSKTIAMIAMPSGDRHPVQELVHDRLLAEVDAEVSLGVLAQPVDEEPDARVARLLETRVVEAVARLQLEDDLPWRCVLAEEGSDRVTDDLDRQDAQEVEQEQRPQDAWG